MNITLFHIKYARLFWIYFTKNNENIDNLSIRIYVNKIENKYTCKIKTEHVFGLLTPETIRLLGSIGNKITKYKTVKMYHI